MEVQWKDPQKKPWCALIIEFDFLEKDTMDVWVNGTVLDTAVSFFGYLQIKFFSFMFWILIKVDKIYSITVIFLLVFVDILYICAMYNIASHLQEKMTLIKFNMSTRAEYKRRY